MSYAKYVVSNSVYQANKERFDTLASLRRNVDWDRENERAELVRRIMIILGDEWQGALPNLGTLFRRKEIDRLLKTAVASQRYRRQFIDLVIRTGYRDVPKLDRDGGVPYRRRTTAIHKASQDQCPDVEAIGRLFEIYARHDINFVDGEGVTHFHVACASGCVAVVQSFLQLGQDPNCLQSETGDTPLDLALDNDREEVARLLLHWGADPNLGRRRHPREQARGPGGQEQAGRVVDPPAGPGPELLAARDGRHAPRSGPGQPSITKLVLYGLILFFLHHMNLTEIRSHESVY